MSNDRDDRKIFWWSLPISPDDSAEVGGRMMRAILIWIGVIAALAVILGVVQTIT